MNTEQLYTDFTEKLLPKIAEGFMITKDYFLDLFGRYVQYLIVTDLIMAGIFALLLLAVIITARVLYKKTNKIEAEGKSYSSDLATARIAICVFSTFFGLIFFCIGVDKILDVVKDVYVPEVRIYELLFANKDTD